MQQECSSHDDCADQMSCVLNRCRPTKNICDANGNCPDGYQNYWGTCLPELSDGCEDIKGVDNDGCPHYAVCNPKDKNCYVVPCWSDKDCSRVNPSLKCLKTSSIGLGHCYK